MAYQADAAGAADGLRALDALALGAGLDRHIAKTSSFEIPHAAVRDLNT